MKNLKTVKTQNPSFPDVLPNRLLNMDSNKLWQVICGDKGHWRIGFYSPDTDSLSCIHELERHSCPELFILLSGHVSLVIEEDEKIRIIELEPLRPILVNTWHNGFCPNGKNAGVALVVERDEFTTEYKTL